MNKEKIKKQEKHLTTKNVDKIREDKQNDDEYAYDFVPNLNEWLNIDKQRKKTEELEDI